MTRPRAVAAGLVLAAALITGCGDGTPGFCRSLEQSADLDELGAAIDAGDLDVATAEAERLEALSEEAPVEVRADLEALSDAVVQIVRLLRDETDGSTDAATLERRREQLNDDLGDLDLRVDRVTTWALQECGLRL